MRPRQDTAQTLLLRGGLQFVARRASCKHPRSFYREPVHPPTCSRLLSELLLDISLSTKLGLMLGTVYSPQSTDTGHNEEK